MKWLTENPMKALDAPEVPPPATLPFERDEMQAIFGAASRFPLKGIIMAKGIVCGSRPWSCCFATPVQ